MGGKQGERNFGRLKGENPNIEIQNPKQTRITEKGELNRESFRGSAYAEATARQVTRHGESVRMADSDNWEESGGSSVASFPNSDPIRVIRARHGGARPKAKAGNPRFNPSCWGGIWLEQEVIR